jgi:hypothetical protein
MARRFLSSRASRAKVTVRSRWAHALAVIASLFVVSVLLPVTDSAAQSKATTLTFGGTDYLHRWSKGGQNEFTPEGDRDLARWRDMVTINTHESVRNGDQLAALANSIVGNYQKHGKIVRTDSKPRTQQRPAEHLIVAVLGNAELLEAVFARVVLVDGVGEVAVYSHRIYGKEAGGPMSEWLKTNGPSIEKSLMAWDKIPSLAGLRQLPQSK